MELLNVTTLLHTPPTGSDVPSVRPVQKLILLAACLLALASSLHAARHFKCSSISPATKRLTALGIVAGVLLYCYVADRTSVLCKLPKQSDELIFLILCLLALVGGVATVQNGPSTEDILEKACHESEFELIPRQQTEEWKGWLQIVILLYHYFAMSKVLHIYRIVRVLVGSYLFMTGYGHSIYFLRTSDFSFRRVAAVLIRLNLLACVLPFIMGTKYDLYYFPALSTFWFLVTWVAIPKTATGTTNWRKVILQILIACLSTEILFAVTGFWDLCAAFLRSVGMVDLDAREFVFRLSLDRYIPYVGMLTACASEYARHSSPLSDLVSFRRLPHLGWRTLVTSLCTLGGYLVLTTGLGNKQSSNRFHAFTEAIPILVFALIRNFTPALRRHHSRLFTWFGKCSLETFILQYHIWLASDTMELLCLGYLCDSSSDPGLWSIGCLLEWCFLSGIFLLASHLAGNATAYLTAWIVSPKHSDMEPANGEPGEQRNFNISSSIKTLARYAGQCGPKQKLVVLLVLLWLLNAAW